jgi:hypothetical protein
MAKDMQTLNAMNADQTLILIRERHLFIFWIALSVGVGAFAFSKLSK